MLSKHERNYSIPELELLCVVWAIEHFRPYLYGRTFQIITDHKALTMVMKMKKPTSKITRMLLQLQEYDYYFTFRPGKLHHAADALTRLPTSEDTLAEEITLLETSEQLYFFDPCNDHSEFDHAELNSLQIPISSSSQPPISLEQSISLEQFKMEQRKDLELNPLFEYLEHNNSSLC